MKKIFLSFCFVSALLVAPVMHAETYEEPTAPADKPQNPSPCGDGTCNEIEETSGGCPKDCGGEPLPPVDEDKKLCGDGTCDEVEETSGGCPKDCGGEPLPQPNGQGQPPSDEGKQLCGDGTCDEHEKKTGKCKQDCEESEM